MFYDQLGVERAGAIRLAVIDRWRAFQKGTEAHAPPAAILDDKCHVQRQLNDAMDTVRKAEYKRLTNRTNRTFITGQKSVLLSHRANLSIEQ